MKKATIIFGLIFTLLGCNNLDKGDGDLLYKIYEDKTGPLIDTDDFVGLVVEEKTERDSVTFTSHDYERPSYMYMGNPIFNGDLFSALRLLSLGDSATLKINLDSMVNHGRPRPANVRGKYLVYNVRITDVLKKGSLTDSGFNENVNAFVRKKETEWMKAEPYQIQKFIRMTGVKPRITNSGLYYYVIRQGKGAVALERDSVDVHYQVSLMSGKIIDSTYPSAVNKQVGIDEARAEGPLRWSEGTGSRFYTPGFNEAMTKFPKGTKARLIIPSHLAYGAEGNKGIPPFIPLIVDMEIINIIPNKR